MHAAISARLVEPVLADTASAASPSAVGLAPGKNYPAGGSPISVTTATLNGHVDIVVANVYGGVSVLLGNGTGTFSAPKSYAAGSGPYSVSATDINGDGNQDVVVADYNGGASVLLGNGQGGLGAPVSYSADNQPISVTTARLNHAEEDIVVANFKSGDVSVLVQHGGKFAPAANFAAGVGPDDVTTADVSGDGNLDLIVSDFNGGVSVLLGDGHGHFGAATNYAAGTEPSAVVAADLNGDGRPDLIVADRLGGVSVLLNNGLGFAAPVSYNAGSEPASVATADLTGNGLLDIIVANFNGNVSILMNTGEGVFAKAVNYAAGKTPVSVTTADVNGDGKPDIIVADEGGGVTVLINTSTNSAMSFTAETVFTPVPQTHCFARGTRITTPYGPKAVEELRVDDLVATATGAQPIVWIGRRRLDLANHPCPQLVRPIRFAVGALGDSLPVRPLLLSPDHALLIDGVLIAARQLDNGVSVAPYDMDAVEYFHVELPRHDILFAEGVAAESYLDSGDRMQLDGAEAVAPRAAFGRADSPHACAPLVTDAAIVQPIWAWIAERAGIRPGREPLTVNEPALRLALNDGSLLTPARIEADGRHVFVLPDDGFCGRARLLSRHAAPTDIRPWLDDRRELGVAVAAIAVWTPQDGFAPRVLPLDSLAADAGWWATEHAAGQSWRWTDGDAAIDLPVGCRRVFVTIRSVGEYPMHASVERRRAAV